jgi:hypothetical protein
VVIFLFQKAIRKEKETVSFKFYLLLFLSGKIFILVPLEEKNTEKKQFVLIVINCLFLLTGKICVCHFVKEKESNTFDCHLMFVFYNHTF